MTLPPDKKSRWLWPVTFVVAIFILIDELARPVYRPLIAWIATWRIMARFTAAIEPLPRFVILVLFAIPFAIAEPLKVVALLLIARGLVVTGIVLMIFAYLMTFLIVERIYHAGRGKLLTYPWFAWAMRQIGRVRSYFAAYRAAIVARAKTWLGLAG